MLTVAIRVQSSLLVAKAWHARYDAASSVVVAAGIIGTLAGYPWFDLIAAFVVSILILRMGYTFAYNAIHDLMDLSIDSVKEFEIKTILLSTLGVAGFHDLKTRKSGDLILVDGHLEVQENLSVRDGHNIAIAARKRVLQNNDILNVMVISIHFQQKSQYETFITQSV